MMERLGQPLILLVIGIGLSVQPFFTDSRWVWNGIPTEYMGYIFAAGGLIWSLAALRAPAEADE